MPSQSVRPAPPPPPDPANVRGLVARVQAGDREAFGLIYSRYADDLYRFVLRRTNDRQLAEDLTSETFLRALKGIDSFVWQGADFGAWLTVIAKHVIANHFKLHRVQRERPVADMRDADLPDTRNDPERAAVDHDARRILLAGVQQLSQSQRECIVLRFLRDLSIEETARLMGRTESAVKALQSRAVRALRGLVTPMTVMPV